jgi:uncharacterized protein YjiK
VLQHQPVQGIQRPQGLTYHPDTQTLFTVLPQQQALAELDRCGNLLRRISVRNGTRLGAAIAAGQGVVLFSLANTSQLLLVPLPQGATQIDGSDGIQLEVRDDTQPIAIAAMAWDRAQRQLYLSSASGLPRLYRTAFDGNVWSGRRNNPQRLTVREWLPEERILPVMPAITALAMDEERSELLLLSGTTHQLVRASPQGLLRLDLSLTRGNAGLEPGIRDPQGLAAANDGSL